MAAQRPFRWQPYPYLLRWGAELLRGSLPLKTTFTSPLNSIFFFFFFLGKWREAHNTGGHEGKHALRDRLMWLWESTWGRRLSLTGTVHHIPPPWCPTSFPCCQCQAVVEQIQEISWWFTGVWFWLESICFVKGREKGTMIETGDFRPFSCHSPLSFSNVCRTEFLVESYGFSWEKGGWQVWERTLQPHHCNLIK